MRRQAEADFFDRGEGGDIGGAALRGADRDGDSGVTGLQAVPDPGNNVFGAGQ